MRPEIQELYRKSVVAIVHDLWTHGGSRPPLPSAKVVDLNPSGAQEKHGDKLL